MGADRPHDRARRRIAGTSPGGVLLDVARQPWSSRAGALLRLDSGMAWKELSAERDPLLRRGAAWRPAASATTCAASPPTWPTAGAGDRLAAGSARGEPPRAPSRGFDQELGSGRSRDAHTPEPTTAGADRDLDPARRAGLLRATERLDVSSRSSRPGTGRTWSAGCSAWRSPPKPPHGFMHDIVVQDTGERKGTFDIKHGGLLPSWIWPVTPRFAPRCG